MSAWPAPFSLTSGRSFRRKDSVALIPWRNITASVRRALVLAAVLKLLLTGTEVWRWR
jgi:hypothetical protein